MTEGPYELPAGWRWETLGRACVINPQRPRLEVDPEYPTTFVPMAAVDGDTGGIVLPEVRPFERVRRGYTYFEEGDVLFAKITPCMENGKSAIARGLAGAFGFGSTEFHVLRPSNGVIAEWVWLFVRRDAFRAAARNAFRGAVGQQRVPQEFLEETLVPLPPVDEQRRIVAQVEALMERIQEGRRLRQQAKDETERLWQSILADAFPKPGADLPSGWRWVRLGEMFDIQQGASMSPRRRAGQSPRPFLRTKNILWGSIELSTVDEMDSSQEETEKLRLRPGDLLVCEGGDVGRCAVWEGALPLVLYQNHIHRLRRTDAETDPHLVRYWMEAAYEVFGAYEGTESRTAIPNLSANRLKNFRFPLPPIIEQGRIVDRLHQAREHIDELKAAQEETEARLKTLEQSILDKAFRGEL